MGSLRRRLDRLEAASVGSTGAAFGDPRAMTDAQLIAGIRAYVGTLTPSARLQFRADCRLFGATPDELDVFGLGEDGTS